jgi:hypothetical protein
MPESWSSKDSPRQHAGRLAAPGYVYDPVYLEHDTGEHPENAGRWEAIIADLDWKGLPQQLKAIPAGPATLDELTGFLFSLAIGRKRPAFRTKLILTIKAVSWPKPKNV